MGYNDLILQGAYGKVPKKIGEVIKKVEDLTQSLIKMVNEFLDITQFQMGKNILTLKPNTDITPMIQKIVEELKFNADKKGIYVKFEKPEKVALINADLEKLKAGLYNVFDNCVKYTEKGGVTIKIESGNVLRIVCSDTGIGMSKERLEKLFHSTFERGEEARKQFVTGRGIGLYIASEIIKAHNGKIWAESEGEGKGSQFYIELPITK